MKVSAVTRLTIPAVSTVPSSVRVLPIARTRSPTLTVLAAEPASRSGVVFSTARGMDPNQRKVLQWVARDDDGRVLVARIDADGEIASTSDHVMVRDDQAAAVDQEPGTVA